MTDISRRALMRGAAAGAAALAMPNIAVAQTFNPGGSANTIAGELLQDGRRYRTPDEIRHDDDIRRELHQLRTQQPAKFTQLVKVEMEAQIRGELEDIASEIYGDVLGRRDGQALEDFPGLRGFAQDLIDMRDSGSTPRDLQTETRRFIAEELDTIAPFIAQEYVSAIKEASGLTVDARVAPTRTHAGPLAAIA
ncbi:MAG: hypothetical protein AAF569_02390 [Pseudomonadota bacterium]